MRLRIQGHGLGSRQSFYGLDHGVFVRTVLLNHGYGPFAIGVENQFGFRIEGGGVNVVTSKTPEDFASYVSAESARWGKLARESGATID